MPRSAKKTGGPKGHQLVQQTPQNDFTLAEFADAAPTGAVTGRMKKATTRKWDKKATELCVKSTEGDGLAWYEKDLSDFELEEKDDSNTEDGDVELDCPKIRGKKKAKIMERFSGGIDYPYDVWCLIGDYISPESVAKFASICKTSYMVVHSARFWSKLYQRHFVEDCGLPDELRPRFMEKTHGLRTRVIRSLFYMYTPLVARVTGMGPFGDELDTLLGSRCVLMWYKKFKGYWRFYFKLQPSQSRELCPLLSEHSSNTHSRFRRFETRVDYNSEQYFSVLQITTMHYQHLAVVMGQQLVKTSIGIGHAMRYHKIRLTFSPLSLLTKCRGGPSLSSNSVAVVIDHAVSARVLHWWDPKYPHQSSVYVT